MPSDNKSIADSDAIFARAYAAAIKSLLGVSGAVGKHQLILTGPPAQHGISASPDIDYKHINYLIYKFADALQDFDNPVIGGSEPRGKPHWPVGKEVASEQGGGLLTQARKAFEDADEQSRNIEKKAHKPWKGAKSGTDSKHSKGKRNLQKAEQAVDDAQATLLSGYHPAPTLGKCTESNGLLPGYNQEVMPQLEQPKAITYTPLYNIENYTRTVERWYETTKDILPEKLHWEDYGFGKVCFEGHIGSFFRADVNVDERAKRCELDISGLESKIDLTLAMVGAYKFDTTPDFGENAPDIKTILPELRTGVAKNILAPMYARVNSVLVGYHVQLTVDFRAELINEVDSIYEEVKEKGGTLTVSGIFVSCETGGASSDPNDEYRFEGIKWDKANGFSSMAPEHRPAYSHLPWRHCPPLRLDTLPTTHQHHVYLLFEISESSC
ncbi:hypothetical protein DXG01_002665 [Tephrocybe rancida]|nr:hypothetical protein DXG01_002665 [Tephrocybe rancida]